MKKMILIICIGLLVGVVSYSFYIYTLVVSGKQASPQKKADYIIILGAKVNDETPSLSLQYRIDAAITYLKENPHTVAIASGGQGQGENISEAEAIKQGLIQAGIGEERIYVEDKSTNTLENITFSKRILSKNMKKGVIISSDYHLYRSLSICEKEGLNVTGLPAKTPAVTKVQSYVRESLAIIKYKLFNYI